MKRLYAVIASISSAQRTKVRDANITTKSSPFLTCPILEELKNIFLKITGATKDASMNL